MCPADTVQMMSYRAGRNITRGPSSVMLIPVPRLGAVTVGRPVFFRPLSVCQIVFLIHENLPLSINRTLSTAAMCSYSYGDWNRRLIYSADFTYIANAVIFNGVRT